MKAFLEITGGILRFYPNDGQFGDPFEVVMTVVGDETKAILKGFKSSPNSSPMSLLPAIRECLKKYGFTEAIFYRWSTDKNGDRIRKEIVIKF